MSFRDYEAEINEDKVRKPFMRLAKTFVYLLRNVFKPYHYCGGRRGERVALLHEVDERFGEEVALLTLDVVVSREKSEHEILKEFENSSLDLSSCLHLGILFCDTVNSYSRAMKRKENFSSHSK